MEASVDPLFRGPDWKPITPKRGSFLHADSQHSRQLSRADVNALAAHEGDAEQTMIRQRIKAGLKRAFRA
jgi:hypothetical protein